MDFLDIFIIGVPLALTIGPTVVILHIHKVPLVFPEAYTPPTIAPTPGWYLKDEPKPRKSKQLNSTLVNGGIYLYIRGELKEVGRANVPPFYRNL